MSTLKALNLVLLAFEVFLCTGLFIGFHVVFGHGLGDLIYYAILYLLTITHLILTVKFRNASQRRFVPLLITFSITTILFSLKATIWRGPEFSWRNRKLFYGFIIKNSNALSSSSVKKTDVTAAF